MEEPIETDKIEDLKNLTKAWTLFYSYYESCTEVGSAEFDADIIDEFTRIGFLLDFLDSKHLKVNAKLNYAHDKWEWYYKDFSGEAQSSTAFYDTRWEAYWAGIYDAFFYLEHKEK